MEVDCLPYKETGYFSPIILDFLSGDDKLKPFYSHTPEISSFKAAIKAKQFGQKQREVLSEALLKQYKRDGLKLKTSDPSHQNIEKLKQDNCFTVTTGHQLNLFTGPLYFIYKIVSAIKLAENLKQQHPDQDFVPVYWMASEDHDFDEISFFRFQGEKVSWSTKQTGAVGRMNPQELESVFEQFEKLLIPFASNAEQLKQWFQNAYLKHDTLTEATRYLAHQLFADYGLVIVDGDDASLKNEFIPVLKEELLSEISSEKVAQQSEALGKHYKLQVNPREINLFYLKDDFRKRIEKKDGKYYVLDTSLSFTEAEILEEVEAHPERFSPNVLLRPLYQETILPNLAYIGGGGELAYWFQLKSTFEHFKTPFPLVLLRNSVMVLDEKQKKYFKELELPMSDLFLDEGLLLKTWVKHQSKIDLTLASEKESLKKLYSGLQEQAAQIHDSMNPHIEAMMTKRVKELEDLSEKLIRLERKKHQDVAERVNYLKSTLFPGRGLQERSNNFSEMYLAYGDDFIKMLLNTLKFPSEEFYVITPE